MLQFDTVDGFRLEFDNNVWMDTAGDLVFDNGDRNRPIDCWGDELDGQMVVSESSNLLNIAYALGSDAAVNGFLRVPISDSNIRDMINGRQIGFTPKGEPSTVDIFKSWIRGWDEE